MPVILWPNEESFSGVSTYGSQNPSITCQTARNSSVCRRSQRIAKNYALFRKHFPRVQVYYAVKVNSDPAIVETFYNEGSSFDVASMQEFHTVHELIAHLPTKQRQDFIWNRIIYANPIKPNETLQELDQYKPLVTFDNHEEVKK